jgi:hypothetical protein
VTKTNSEREPVGTRRDDITGEQRAQIAITMLASGRLRGAVKQLTQSYGVSRQTLYEIEAKGQQVLQQGLQPGPHGPHWAEKTIPVDPNRLKRGSVVLTEVGVSQRDVAVCLGELLDTAPSVGWVNGVLNQVEAAAAEVNERWQPQIGETLSGDEIYANGQPNLLLVGNDSLYIYALSRQPDCDGETWGCTLLDGPECPQFASDAGTGLAAGAKAAEIKVHQLDWDHLLRPVWGQAARLERQAYAAMQAVEERAAQFAAATTPKRLQQHLTKWDQLNLLAAEKVAQYDAFARIAQQVDDWFALIDLSTGQLQQVPEGIKQLQNLGEQLQSWSGRIYHKLTTNLHNWAAGLFSYQPLLAEALHPLQTRYGQPAITALCQLWQLEANHKRHPGSKLDQAHQQRRWQHYLDQALAALGETDLWLAWAELQQLLDRSWRGSMLAECVNSLLRPVLDGRKHTDQGCLELFRFSHNVRPFARGKRANHSPAQLVGLDVPNDPLILLGLEPKVSI